MPKTKEELIQEGYTSKQADAIIKERKKKSTAMDDIKRATQEKNKAIDQIANW
jgi:hypothetical protein